MNKKLILISFLIIHLIVGSRHALPLLASNAGSHGGVDVYIENSAIQAPLMFNYLMYLFIVEWGWDAQYSYYTKFIEEYVNLRIRDHPEDEGGNPLALDSPVIRTKENNIFTVNSEEIYSDGELTNFLDIVRITDENGQDDIEEVAEIPDPDVNSRYNVVFKDYTDCEIRSVFLKFPPAENYSIDWSTLTYPVIYSPSPKITNLSADLNGNVTSYNTGSIAWEYTGPTTLDLGDYNYEIKIVNTDTGDETSIPGLSSEYTGAYSIPPGIIDNTYDYDISLKTRGPVTSLWSEYTQIHIPSYSFGFIDLPEGSTPEDPFTYALMLSLQFDPGISSQYVDKVKIWGSIKTGGGTLSFDYNQLIDVELDPDENNNCTIHVSYIDSYGYESAEIVKTLRVETALSVINLIQRNSLYEVKLGFQAGNLPQMMRLTGDITGPLQNNYIEFQNTLSVHVTPFPGKKIVHVDYWNTNNDSHASASVEFAADQVEIPIIYEQGSAEDPRVRLIFSETEVPVSTMELTGDIAEPVPGERIAYVEEAAVRLTPEAGDKHIYVTLYDSDGYEVGHGRLQLTLAVSDNRIVTQDNLISLSRGIGAQYSFYIQNPGDVEIKVYEVTGELIKEIYEGFYQGGILQIQWDGRNESGKKVAQGVYLLFCKYGSTKEIKKIVVSD
ncbi:MAG: hypothetical protein ABII23_03905 [bacterium]